MQEQEREKKNLPENTGDLQEQKAGEGVEKPKDGNPTHSRRADNDDYKREGVHLGASETSGSTRKGGGGSGYDVDREQSEVNKEQEHMHQERDNEQLAPERTQTPRPETDPGRERPQPETRPGTSTMGNAGRDISGSWSQSSWDPNSIR